MNVTANVDATLATPGETNADLDRRVLPEIQTSHPGVLYSHEGPQPVGPLRAERLALAAVRSGHPRTFGLPHRDEV